MNESCLNNLNDVYKQYCKDARPLEKHLRNIFVTGTVDDVLQNFQVGTAVTVCEFTQVVRFQFLYFVSLSRSSRGSVCKVIYSQLDTPVY